jgi:hypothetical protein
MQRRQILTNGETDKKDKLDFIDEIGSDKDEQEEAKAGTELNLVIIVLENILN